MPLSLTIAIKHLRYRRRQSLVSVLGVALGVGFFIALAALMQGFQGYILSTVVDVSPHIRIQDEYRTPRPQPATLAYPDTALISYRGLRPRDERRGIREYREIVEALKKMPQIVFSTSLSGQAFLRYGTAEVSASIQGIIPADERTITRIEHDMSRGSFDDLLTAPNGIILGQTMARRLGVSMGDSLTAVSSRGLTMRVKVVGILATGIATIDESMAYMLLKKVQILEEKPNRVSDINLRLSNPDDAPALAVKLEQRFQWKAESWKEANSGIFGVFTVQNIVMYSTVSAIMVVAAFGIFNIISTIIHEKTRDIAILKSLGFREKNIRAIFVWQGLIVALIGVIIGWILGYGLSSALAAVRLHIGGMIESDHLFILWSFWHYGLSALFSITAALFAAWLPARKAASLNPVDIIRGVG